MKISIVIPVYNEADSLSACLDAIAAQTTLPHEVIVVDNNSTDASIKVAEHYPFVKVLKEPHQGIVYARNRGYDVATGDIIARIDADSIVPTYWAEHIQQFYSQPHHQAQAFSGGAYFYNVRLARSVAWLYNFLAFDFNGLLIGHPTLWGSNMALTAKQWRAVRESICLKTDVHEDLDLAMHLHRLGYGIYYDRRFRIGAYMRRVQSDRSVLWAYLQLWPNTLKTHARRSWWLAWLFGCLMLYYLTPVLGFAERATSYVSNLLTKTITEN